MSKTKYEKEAEKAIPDALTEDAIEAKVAQSLEALKSIWGKDWRPTIRPLTAEVKEEGKHTPRRVLDRTHVEFEVYLPSAEKVAQERAAHAAALKAKDEEAEKAAEKEAASGA